jgi:RNA polymerase sigma factor (sigma-70 family)
MTAMPDWAAVGDAELATAAAAGDRDAFACIYDRYADRLHDFCVGMLRNRDTAADCVQEVFLIAATRLGQLKDPEKLRPWLYSIARNEALRCIRGGGRERVYDEVPEAMSSEPGPEIMAARNELANLVAEAAGGLSDRDRSVLELSYRHGLDGPELAEALGVSHANAKKLTQRMRDTIEKSLGALLVSRRAANKCSELAAVLDGWDEQFTVLMRKRIARHIESCPVCDQERSRLVNPVALLGATPAFIPAPHWLRARTLEQVRLPAAGQNAHAASDSDAMPVTGGRRRVLVAGAIVAAIVAAGLGLIIAGMVERNPVVSPANHTSSVPPPPSAPPPRAPQVVTAPPAMPSPSAEAPATTTLAVTPESSTTPPAGRPVTTTIAMSTSPQAPAPPTVPPTSASAPQTLPTFTVPSSNAPTTTTQPPSSVVKPTNPVVRPTATVIKPPPVTTTPPVLQ